MGPDLRNSVTQRIFEIRLRNLCKWASMVLTSWMARGETVFESIASLRHFLTLTDSDGPRGGMHFTVSGT